MKYNLRFIWKTHGLDPTQIENYSQSYIREISNIGSYQLNRNELERELLRRNEAEAARYAFHNHAVDLQIDLSPDGGPHTVSYTRAGERRTVKARWVVDCAGRAHVLQKQLGLKKSNNIRHGASFLWVDGLLNYENLTDMTPKQIRLNPQRRHIGHLPFWLATNHFVEEGLWFWVIPLQGVTSLGLVYDHRVVNPDDVNDPKKLVPWICEHFPLFERDLPNRTILHAGSYRDYSFDAVQTISRNRWAMVGEAGRWSDPLYSPGGDVISIYNTLVVDSILTTDQADLDLKVPLYEELERAVYAAYLPSFEIAYDCLGDQEAHSLPLRLGADDLLRVLRVPVHQRPLYRPPLHRRVPARVREAGPRQPRPADHAAGVFPLEENASRTGDPADLLRVLRHPVADGGGDRRSIRSACRSTKRGWSSSEQLANTMTLARYIAAHIYSMTLDEPFAVWNRSFVASLDLEKLTFDPEQMAADYAAHATCTDRYEWPEGWNPEAAFVFRTKVHPVHNVDAVHTVEHADAVRT